MSKTKASYHGSINLSKINEDEIWIDPEGNQILNIKINIFHETNKQGNDLMIGQRFNNPKHSDGTYKFTPILGNARRPPRELNGNKY